jgi:iron complex transport system substrate-binding protein
MGRSLVPRWFAFVAALALTVAACGGAGDALPDGSPAGTGFPVEAAGVTIPAAPQRIVSASASHTEVLYAIGAGPSVVATDLFSNYPPEAERTEKIDAFNLSVEAVAALDPDLVILAFDPGGAVDALSGLGIPTLLFDPPIAIDDVYAQIATLGRATGRDDEAASLVARMRNGIERVAATRAGSETLTYYHELDPTLYSVASGTFIGSLYGLLGLESIVAATDADPLGYAQLSAEFVLDADPDFVFLADTRCCGESAATVAARPGWDQLSAVREGRVVELDDDVASRWGPRLVDFLTAVAEAVGGAS